MRNKLHHFEHFNNQLFLKVCHNHVGGLISTWKGQGSSYSQPCLVLRTYYHQNTNHTLLNWKYLPLGTGLNPMVASEEDSLPRAFDDWNRT